jgi:hypothetical protein
MSRTLVSLILSALLLFSGSTEAAELKPLADLKAVTAVDKERSAQVEDLALKWWMKNRGMLAEESLTVAGYFSVVRPIANFAERNDRIWEVRVIHMHAGGPTGVLWVNDRTGSVMGLGVENTPISDLQQMIPGGFGKYCLYEKHQPMHKPWSEDISKANIISDNSLQVVQDESQETKLLKLRSSPPRPKIREQEVFQALSTYRVISGEDWRHKYHHVAGLDQTGWLVRPDASQLKWLIRPGGLALVVYPDGGTIFLAREVH